MNSWEQRERAQLTLGQIWLHVPFGGVSQAKAYQRSIQQGASAVEDELPFHADIEFAPVLLELPRI